MADPRGFREHLALLELFLDAFVGLIEIARI
jgi:hypothetical protein